MKKKLIAAALAAALVCSVAVSLWQARQTQAITAQAQQAASQQETLTKQADELTKSLKELEQSIEP